MIVWDGCLVVWVLAVGWLEFFRSVVSGFGVVLEVVCQGGV